MSNRNQNSIKNQLVQQKKSINVRNFDSYYNALTEHSAATNNIKSSNTNMGKEIFTTSKTINKKSPPFKKSSSGTKIPQPVSIVKPHNCMLTNKSETNNGGVTYGELQIIISNIQIIKSKAKQQIQTLEEENHKQFVQLQKYKSVMAEYVKFQEELKEKQQTLEKLILQKQQEFQLKEENFSKRQKEIQKKIKQMQNEKKQFQEQKQKINQQLEIINNQLQQERRLKKVIAQQYDDLVNVLTSNQPKRINQIIWQINNKYENQSVLQIFSQYQKQALIHKKQNEALYATIQQQKNRVAQYSLRVKQTQDLLTQMRQENKRLITRNQLLQEKRNSIRKQFQQLLDEQRKITFQLKQKNGQLYQALQEKTIELHNLKEISSQDIKNKEIKISKLQKQLSSLKKAEDQKQLDEEYLRLVDIECSQLQDYDDLLKRLQFLQKNKIQNRNNIEKVQYLCKMLDY